MTIGLDGRFYTDPEVFAAELDQIFARTWVLVGHSSQVARPGQVLRAQVGDESVLVVNDGATVRALYNVCQHRGHQLITTDDPVETKVITCPYHAWTYDLDGSLLHARGEDVGPLSVPSARVESLAGFLFVNLDPHAPPLAEVAPGVEDEILDLAPDARERRLTSRRTHLIAANWKIAVENYNECYHCPNVHKAFTRSVVAPDSYRVTPDRFTIRHSARAPEGADGRYGSFFSWPASSIQCYPGHVLNTFRWIPVAVDRTLLVREWWFDTDHPNEAQRAIIDLDWDTTVAEDFDLMESVQVGVRSRGYRPGPLIVDGSGVADVHSENSIPHLHQLLRDALEDG